MARNKELAEMNERLIVLEINNSSMQQHENHDIRTI